MPSGEKILPKRKLVFAYLGICLLSASVLVYWNSLHKATPETLFTIPSTASFINIDYLASGYNIYYGDPRTSSAIDPGFRINQIFNLTYTHNLTTEDLIYVVPDNVTVVNSNICSLDYSSTVITSLSDLQNSFELDVGANVGVDVGEFSGSFSASASYQTQSESISSTNSVWISSNAKCVQYRATIEAYLFPPLSNNFKDAVATLPNTYNQTAYFNFINAFGTHYIQELYMGAKFGYIDTISSQSYQTMQSSNIDVGMAASASYGTYVSGGISADVSVGNNAKNQYSSSITNTQEYSIGSKPPQNGSAVEWANEVFSEPMPISYTLSSLDGVVSFYYNTSRPQMVANLITGLISYCSSLVSAKVSVQCVNPSTSGSLNLLLGAPSFQSSTYNSNNFPWAANKANDGNTNCFATTQFNTTSISSTQSDYYAWWSANMTDYRSIQFVNIFKRADPGAPPLNNFFVRVGNDSNPNNNPACTNNGVAYDYTGAVISVTCGGLIGMYVGLATNGQGQIQLCEVQAYSNQYYNQSTLFKNLNPFNVLYNQGVIPIGTSVNTLYSYLAIDGIIRQTIPWTCSQTLQYYQYTSCAALCSQWPLQFANQLAQNSYNADCAGQQGNAQNGVSNTAYQSNLGGNLNSWAANMGQSYFITTVTTFGRTDGVTGQLSNYQITVGNSSNFATNPACQGGQLFSDSQTITCNLQGQYLALIQPNGGQLTLVEIWAASGPIVVPTGPVLLPGNLLRQTGTVATASSTLPGGWVPSRAIDGNTDQNWQDGSCFSSSGTGTAVGDWWAAQMPTSTFVGYVIVFMRTDGYLTQGTPYQVSVGNNPNPSLNTWCSGGAQYSQTQNVTCNLTGQYVGVQLFAPGTMTICEVQAYS